MHNNRKRKYSCYEKAIANNEETFTLRAQDESSPIVILEWIKLNITNRHMPEAKLRDAFESVLEMRRFDAKKQAD